MRDRISLWLIIAARRLTTWGWTDDHLAEAEERQRNYTKEGKRDGD